MSHILLPAKLRVSKSMWLT